MGLADYDDRIFFNNRHEISDYVAKAIREAEAWQETAKMLTEAHDYVSKYCLTEGWGKNVWHTVLKDAIKLRKVLQQHNITVLPE